MALNWIDVNQYSFNSFLMMERFQIRYICARAREWDELKTNLGIALRHNPTVQWYFAHKCPECSAAVEEIAAGVPSGQPREVVRNAEVFVMVAFEDFVVYCYPDVMDTNCDFIYNWDKEKLFELAYLTDKVALDVGSGSGRLAFAAAEKARHVYASEPVDKLREHLRDKIARERIGNVTVVDGTVERIPYPDGMFDVVMSGHVVGDNLDAEIAEMSRVAKSGGWMLDCPGERNDKSEPNRELMRRGWEMFHYVGKTGGDVYRYRKQVFK